MRATSGNKGRRHVPRLLVGFSARREIRIDRYSKNHRKNNGLTNSSAGADMLGGASFEVTVIAGFVSVPANARTATFTLNWHVALAGRRAPVRLMVLPAAVRTPPLHTVAVSVCATSPVGKISLKATPVREVAFGFWSVNVTVTMSPGLV